MPYVLAGKKIPDKEGDVKDSLVSTGIDIRYQPRSDLTGMVSVNPDFSQVEQAVSDISFSYSEKAIKDNRPFFAEGRGYFAKEDDNSIFYSNRVGPTLSMSVVILSAAKVLAFPRPTMAATFSVPPLRPFS